MMRRLVDVVEAGLRSARVPRPVAAKVLSHVEEVEEEYGITSLAELLRMPDWYLWLVVIKSTLSPVSRMLRREGYCHATASVVAALMALDERLAQLIREWVITRCKAGNDPCCSNPRCCNLA